MRYAYAVMAVVLLIVFAASVTGCASSEGYARYLQAQSAAIKAQKPMLRIVAQEGVAITGLASIEVFGPGMSIQQERENEWARVATSGLNVLGVVGGIVAAGKASEDLVKAVGGLGMSTTLTNITTDNSITDSYNAVATPTVVNPVIMPQPAPVIVTQPAPTVVYPVVVTP